MSVISLYKDGNPIDLGNLYGDTIFNTQGLQILKDNKVIINEIPNPYNQKFYIIYKQKSNGEEYISVETTKSGGNHQSIKQYSTSGELLESIDFEVFFENNPNISYRYRQAKQAGIKIDNQVVIPPKYSPYQIEEMTVIFTKKTGWIFLIEEFFKYDAYNKNGEITDFQVCNIHRVYGNQASESRNKYELKKYNSDFLLHIKKGNQEIIVDSEFNEVLVAEQIATRPDHNHYEYINNGLEGRFAIGKTGIKFSIPCNYKSIFYTRRNEFVVGVNPDELLDIYKYSKTKDDYEKLDTFIKEKIVFENNEPYYIYHDKKILLKRINFINGEKIVGYGYTGLGIKDEEMSVFYKDKRIIDYKKATGVADLLNKSVVELAQNMSKTDIIKIMQDLKCDREHIEENLQAVAKVPKEKKTRSIGEVCVMLVEIGNEEQIDEELLKDKYETSAVQLNHIFKTIAEKFEYQDVLNKINLRYGSKIKNVRDYVKSQAKNKDGRKKQ